MDILLPLVVLAAVWLGGAKLVTAKLPSYLPALAGLCAHLAWNISGVAMLGAWGLFAFDFAARVGLVLWLWFKPNLWVAAMLGLYTLWSAAQYVADPFGGSGTNLPMLALHLFILGALLYGFLKSRPVKSAA